MALLDNVPDDFGVGIIVYLITDRYGTVNYSDNYMAFTITFVIPKVFFCL